MTLPDRICDPHHHLWDRPDSHYLVAQLRDDLATVPHVTCTVFVECSAWYRDSGPEHLREVGETEWVAEHAAELVGGDTIQGIVAATDLRLGERAEQALHAHIEASGGRFRGIRHRATWDPSPLIRRSQPDPGEGLLLDPDFRRGFALLDSLGGVFDAWVYFPQLSDVADLARSFPESTIVLNHLGGPITLGPYSDRETMLTRWRTLIGDVATCANVVLKVGGIGMPLYGMTWHKQQAPPGAEEVATFWSDPVRYAIDAFGPDRCMLESNFPVDRLSMPYATLWEAMDILTDGYSAAERATLFHDTAVRTYSLPESSAP
jgi:predicted TIM-barrel fold metal-dependent hydrolase